MSFWAESPGPHWSDSFWSFLSATGSSITTPLRNGSRTQPIGRHSTKISRATKEDCEELADFLRKHFTITQKAVCRIDSATLESCLESGWICMIARDASATLIGSVVSRSLGTGHVQQKEGRLNHVSELGNSGFIDFLCVHPTYQKKGLASDLLKWIDYETGKENRHIHFFQKELTPLLKVPPLYAGQYIARKVIVSQPSETVTEITDFTNDWAPYRRMKEIHAPLLIVTRPDKLADHTKLYCYNTRGCKIYLVITDTFHRVSRTGERMGEVLFYWADIAETPDSIIANAIEVMIDSAGYEIVLMDSRVPHIPKWGWKADSPYYLYTYNMNPRRFFSVKPWFWF